MFPLIEASSTFGGAKVLALDRNPGASDVLPAKRVDGGSRGNGGGTYVGQETLANANASRRPSGAARAAT